MKKSTLEFDRRAASDVWHSLPDFSANWRLPEPKASNAEIEARFYYEFARESETVLRLAETLCHFSRGELRRAQRRTLNYPGSALHDLHPHCSTIVETLVPRINLRGISWNQLEPEQRQNLIDAFSREPAFRRLDKLELINFAQEFVHPTERECERSEIDPRWHTGSHLYWDGIEEIAIRIDWSQGPQAVKKAMEKWFQRHKRGLLRLRSEGRLPGGARTSYMYKLPDETGAKNPRKKHIVALRGLGAMRLRGSHSLPEAIKMAGSSLFSRDPGSRSAWNQGIKKARQTFHELFYPCDEYSLQLRRHWGLPEIEEPISYQRYCRRRKNK